MPPDASHHVGRGPGLQEGGGLATAQQAGMHVAGNAEENLAATMASDGRQLDEPHGLTGAGRFSESSE